MKKSLLSTLWNVFLSVVQVYLSFLNFIRKIKSFGKSNVKTITFEIS